jgi:hypothetical protein
MSDQKAATIFDAWVVLLQHSMTCTECSLMISYVDDHAGSPVKQFRKSHGMDRPGQTKRPSS